MVLSALAAVYFIWGSTYLGIRYALEGFPPMLMNGLRFVVAGGLMYLWLRYRGMPRPTARQWRHMAYVGLLLIGGGVGLVTIAEDLGVGSGLTATAVAVLPLWAALFAGLFGGWPRPLEWAGLAIGIGGVALLSLESDFRSSGVAVVLVIIAPIFWSFGSVWSSRLDLPRTAMATAGQMLTGGAAFLVVGAFVGERPGVPNLRSVAAMAYLVVLGSWIAFNAYTYLLRTVRPALATSYAYANPVVALALGITIGNENVTGPVWAALPLILVGLGLVGLAQRTGRSRMAAAAPPSLRAR